MAEIINFNYENDNKSAELLNNSQVNNNKERERILKIIPKACTIQQPIITYNVPIANPE
jgi:hypothetical protein